MSDVAAAAAADVRAAWRGTRLPTGEPVSTCVDCGDPIVLVPAGWIHRDGPAIARPHPACPPAGLGEHNPRREQ